MEFSSRTRTIYFPLTHGNTEIKKKKILISSSGIQNRNPDDSLRKY